MRVLPAAEFAALVCCGCALVFVDGLAVAGARPSAYKFKVCLPLADAWNISEITRLVNASAVAANPQRIAYSNAVLQALGG
jgi:hypothetical protein